MHRLAVVKGGKIKDLRILLISTAIPNKTDCGQNFKWRSVLWHWVAFGYLVSISATFHITMALCDCHHGCKLSLNCTWTWTISSFRGLNVVALKADGLRCRPKTSASLQLWAVGDPLLDVSPHLSLSPYFILALCSVTVKGFESCPQRRSPHVFLLYPLRVSGVYVQ